MTVQTLRKIALIDEERCDGCGLCIPSCAEGAIEIVDGKARLIAEKYCDGLGACLGECPQGAIIIEQWVADEFDEEAVELLLEATKHAGEELACGCPAASVAQFGRPEVARAAAGTSTPQESMLGQWPVQLTLVPPTAPFLRDADLMLVADCVPFAYAGFHQDFLEGHALLVACPKLDDFRAHQAKLTDILRHSGVRSLTVVHMEVPCCSGLAHMARQAVRLAANDIPFEEVVIGVRGDLKSVA